jgi:hypothetical protein
MKSNWGYASRSWSGGDASSRAQHSTHLCFYFFYAWIIVCKKWHLEVLKRVSFRGTWSTPWGLCWTFIHTPVPGARGGLQHEPDRIRNEVFVQPGNLRGEDSFIGINSRSTN